MLASILDAFVQQSPVSVMMRGMMEHVFRAERLDTLFQTHAKVQYTQALLFSEVVNLLSLVVCGIHPSVNAAYKAKASELSVARAAFYPQLNGIEMSVSAALLRETAGALSPLIHQMGGQHAPLRPGDAVRMLDGKALAATEPRLKVLRSIAASPLPGKSLVVLDPACGLAVDIFPCEDGQAQERRLCGPVLATVAPGQLWIADRNRCPLARLTGIAQRQRAFGLREHQNLPWEALSEWRSMGVIESGAVLEQAVKIEFEGKSLALRRSGLRLSQPTRHGDSELVVLTNLPIAAADAIVVLQFYRARWQVEG